jgi:membrane associated rhomboid family serine protease
MDDKLDKKKEGEDGPPVYVKYIGLSFQLFGIIGVGTYLGYWIQQRSEMKFPLWILLFCFISVFVAFYQLWVQMKRDK